jgi:hypothetical protein
MVELLIQFKHLLAPPPAGMFVQGGAVNRGLKPFFSI